MNTSATLPQPTGFSMLDTNTNTAIANAMNSISVPYSLSGCTNNNNVLTNNMNTPTTGATSQNHHDNLLTFANAIQLTSSPLSTNTPAIVDKTTKVKSKRKNNRTSAEQKKLTNQLTNHLNAAAGSRFNCLMNGNALGNQLNFAAPFSLTNDQWLALVKTQMNNQSNHYGGQLRNSLTNSLTSPSGDAQFNNGFNSAINGRLSNEQSNSILANHYQFNSRINSNSNSQLSTSSPDVRNKFKSQDESPITNRSRSAINNYAPSQSADVFNNNYQNNADKDACKSILCDSNGTVFAQIVYRCTACPQLSTLVTEAREHYHASHMLNPATIQQPDSCLVGGQNSSQNSNLKNLSGANLIGNLTDGPTNGLSHSNAFNLIGNGLALQTFTRLSTNSIDNLCNENSTNHSVNCGDQLDKQNTVETTISKILSSLSKQQSNSSNHANTHFKANLNSFDLPSITQQQNLNNLPFNINNFYSNNEQQLQITDGLVEESFGASNSNPTNGSDNKIPSKSHHRTAESCTKSGFINCPVCYSYRFYTTLQRRYGQFTCVACYRFFKEFFLKPQVYVCAAEENCRLNLKQKCKACWINACKRTYTVSDPKRIAILENFKTIRGKETDVNTAGSQANDSQLNAIEDFDLNERSMSNANNNSPNSLLNDEEEDDDELEDEIEDDSNSMDDDEESFPMDFTTTKKQADIKQEALSTGVITSEPSSLLPPPKYINNDTSTHCLLNGSPNNSQPITKNDDCENQPNNTSLSSSSPDTKNKSSNDHLSKSCSVNNHHVQQKPTLVNQKNQDQINSLFTTSILQFDQQLKQEIAIDLNNNLPNFDHAQLGRLNELSNGLAKQDFSGYSAKNLFNGDLNGLGSLNLNSVQENDSPAKKRSKKTQVC